MLTNIQSNDQKVTLFYYFVFVLKVIKYPLDHLLLFTKVFFFFVPKILTICCNSLCKSMSNKHVDAKHS